MRGTALAWGAFWAAFASGAPLGCGLVESTSGLSGHSSGDAAPETSASTDDASDGMLDTGAVDTGAGEAMASMDSSVVDSSMAAVDGSMEAEASTMDAGGMDSSTAQDTGVQDTGVQDTGVVDVAVEKIVAPITFVQVAVATPSGFSATAHAAFAKAQTAGDLNVVAVGWNDSTSSISALTDSAGNTYQLAVGPTRFAPDLSQAIYYAPGIAASASNTVTVTFVQAANDVDLRILEYSGLDSVSPLDTTNASTGKSTGPATTSVTTSTARELLFAAGMSTDLYSGAGTGFTERIVTNDGDLAEDRILSATGTYAAPGPVADSCEWVIQAASFR